MRLNSRLEYDAADVRWQDLYEKHCDNETNSTEELEMIRLEDALNEYEAREGLIESEPTSSN